MPLTSRSTSYAPLQHVITVKSLYACLFIGPFCEMLDCKPPFFPPSKLSTTTAP